MAQLLMPGVREKLMPWLDKSARHPFEWGQTDCMLDVADWLDHACGLDVASAWRGRYSSREDADALMPDGIVAAVRAEAARLGLQEAAQPLPGDVAIVTLEGQDKPLGAILMPTGRWRMRYTGGFLITRSVTVLVAWSLPCRPSSPQP